MEDNTPKDQHAVATDDENEEWFNIMVCPTNCNAHASGDCDGMEDVARVISKGDNNNG